jgi:predicted enzyme related to lactoylglutathione lyase
MAGTVIWHELYTSDVDAATRFYTELLGAEIEVAKTPDADYPMLKKDGRSHAGFFQKDHDDVPSHWYPYIEVDDVDATVEKATSLGSDVYHGPVSMAEIRFAVLGDPQHATYGVLTSPTLRAAFSCGTSCTPPMPRRPSATTASSWAGRRSRSGRATTSSTPARRRPAA